MFKKTIYVSALALLLAACGTESADEQVNTAASNEDEQSEQVEKVSTEKDWTEDERLQEPTENTKCAFCNMKVYTKDHEMGVFSAQAIKADGSLVFYDDIGCLINDEISNDEENEKFVRDYNTLNWFKVDDAFIVKTNIKSPMNWGYIFFKFEDDAKAFIEENEGTELTSYMDVREAAYDRLQQKMKAQEESNDHMDMDEQHNENAGHSDSDGHGH